MNDLVRIMYLTAREKSIEWLVRVIGEGGWIRESN